MVKQFAELRARMTPQARAQSEKKAQTLLAEMPLHELRCALGLLQKMLAEALRVQQPSAAKLVRRTDMYLSTLRSYIDAMGGQLDIVAQFPDGSVKINNFADLASMPA